MNTLIRYDITVQEEDAETLAGVLALSVPFGWEEQSLPTGETRARVHCGNREFMDSLAAEVRRMLPQAQLDESTVPEEDWNEAWREFFTPIACGQRFVVLPPWLRESTDMQGRIPIVIEPKSAFGTGHHATTALCLTVVSDLLDSGRIRPGMNFLDLGTGSGILALGCCLSGLTGTGTDIDPLAVENALENSVINKVQGFEVLPGSVEAVAGRRFDVVLANILAQPLKDLAPQMVALMGQGGCLVLSGLLVIQADGVEAAYTAQGLAPARRVVEGEWAALVWE